MLAGFDVLRRRAEELGEGDRGWVLNGLRGVGKTVLLNALLAQVSDRGWITAKVEAGQQGELGVALARALVRGMRTATGRHPEGRLRRLMGVFSAFSVTVDPAGSVALGADVEAVAGVADSGRFADDLTALFEVLGETARDLGVGVLILVDELQEATPAELVAVNTAVHQLGQSEVALPLVFVGAGLPSLPAQLAEATSYAERLYDYRSVGLLDEDAARAALSEPARQLGVRWASDALKLAAEHAQGYPYLLQAIGKHVWDYAAAGALIDIHDVQVGLVQARREVDDGLYRSRWERATPAQQALLRAVATLGGGGDAATADLVLALGRRRASDLSVARDELIRKGLLYAPVRGRLAFTVPGMHTYVGHQP